MISAPLLLVLLSTGQVELPAAKPVPRMQVIPLPAGRRASSATAGDQPVLFWPRAAAAVSLSAHRSQRQVADADGPSPRSQRPQPPQLGLGLAPRRGRRRVLERRGQQQGADRPPARERAMKMRTTKR